MRKIRVLGLLALGFLFVASVCFAADKSALATLDPSVRSGVLPNGMRYYVLKNQVPKKRVEMRLVVKAGSLQEGPGEHGLAHAVEHMEFEQTSRYKPLEVISYMESIGMAWGPEVNAETNYTNTTYQLSVPTDVSGAVEKGIDVLDDWARGPVVTDALLDKERKILAEEYRLHIGNAAGRYSVALCDMAQEGSPFANQIPLGKLDDISRLTADDVTRFVQAHYTVDAMSVVVVGDADPAAIEKALKARFTSDYGRTSAARPTPAPSFASVSTDAVRFFEDPGLDTDSLVWWKADERVSSDAKGAIAWDIRADVALSALNRRLAELSLQPESGVKEAFVCYEWLVGHGRGISYHLIPRDGMHTVAMASFIMELKRAQAFGVTKGEFELDRDAWKGCNEAYLTQKANIQSADKAARIASAIAEDEYYPYTQGFYSAKKAAASGLGKRDVDEWLTRYAIPSPSRLLVGTVGTQKSRALTESEIGSIVARALEASVSPVVEKPAGTLIQDKPVRGKVIKSEKVAGTPFTKWTLSNGIVAYLYRNENTRNNFQVRAFSAGGLSLLDDGEFWDGTFAAQLLSRNGAGGLDEQGLAKFLSGMRAKIQYGMDANHAMLWGTSDPADPNDMERFFKYLHASLVSPRRDPIAERAVRAQIAEWYAKNANNPEVLYSNEIQSLLTGGNPRFKPLDEARAKALDPERASLIMARWFGNPADLTFVITGEYDETSLKALVETWLASVPARPASDNATADRGIRAFKGPLTKTVRGGKDVKSVVTLLMDSESSVGAREIQLAYILRQTIDIRLNEALRQENAGTYHVDVGFNLFVRPYAHLTTSVQFTCDPQNKDALLAAARKELERIRAGDIDEVTFRKAVAIQSQTVQAGEKTNEYWNLVMYLALAYGIDVRETLSIPAFVDSITKDDLAEFAARVIKGNESLVAILEADKP